MHKVLPDKGNSASVVGSSKCPCPEGLVGWGCRGCDSLSQTHPLCLGWKGKKEGECQEGQDKSKSLGIGFACTSIWSCCWLYFYPGRTAFSPKELLSSASKSRIWLLLLGSPSSKQKPSGWWGFHLTLTGMWWSVHKAKLGEFFRDATMGSGSAVSWKDRILPLTQSTQDFGKFPKV